MIKKPILLLCIVLVSGTALSLSDYERGLESYKKGNYEDALAFYKKAADQGNPDAQFELASMYQLGDGVNENHKESCKWFYKSYEQGNVKAKYQVYLTCRDTKYYHQLRSDLR